MQDASPNGNPGLVSSGIAGLDDVLYGGLPADRLYLIEGDPGAGKTTLGLQFLLDGKARGESGVYVSLSETRDELLGVAASHGWSLDGISLVELTPRDEVLHPDAENTMFHASEVELVDTTRVVLEEIERVKPRRVVFDSLSEMRLLAQNSLRYRRQILGLKQFFVGRNCTVMLLDDRTSDAGDLQLQSLAHGVLSLERRSPDYGVMQRRLQVLKVRGRAFRPGFHDFRIRKGGLEVYPRLVASEHQGDFPAEQISSGIPELDALAGGGLDRGASNLLIGPAGCGKSTFAAHYADRAARNGDRVALFLFDESRHTMLLRSRGLGMRLDQHITSGKLAVTQVDPGALSAGEFINLVRREVEDHDAKMIVIDSLTGYLNAIPDVRFLTLQLHELLLYMSQRGVTSILILAQSGLIGHMHSPVDASYLADTVILLRYFEAGGRVRQAISMVKKRGGAHERTIREFSFGPGGIAIGAPLTQFEGVLSGVPRYIGEVGPLLAERKG